jgi:hypothetical protein
MLLSGLASAYNPAIFTTQVTDNCKFFKREIEYTGLWKPVIFKIPKYQ